MAYGYTDLSPKMEEALRCMKTNGNLIRYNGGFWSWSNVKMTHCKNGSEEYKVPIWYCTVNTLRALAKRGAVALDETANVCKLT